MMCNGATRLASLVGSHFDQRAADNVVIVRHRHPLTGFKNQEIFLPIAFKQPADQHQIAGNSLEGSATPRGFCPRALLDDSAIADAHVNVGGSL